jgi:hypothetical protein
MKIFLVSPGPGSVQAFAPLTLRWEGLTRSSWYLIEFFDEEKGVIPVFSAFTKQLTYTMPPQGYSKYFQKDSVYFWKVTGLDEERNRIGESERRGFSFR